MRFVCRFCKCYFDVSPENARLEVEELQILQCPIMLNGVGHSLFGELKG